MVTPDEKILLVEFRDSIKNVLDEDLEDYLLMVYLRACGMDVRKATEMFNKFLEIKCNLTNSDRLDFRNYNSLEEISNDIRYKCLGNDEEGRLVYWVPAGRWNPRIHIEKGLKKEFCFHCFKCADEICYQLYHHGEKIKKHSTIVVIADFKELSFNKVTHYETLQIGLNLLNDLQILAPLLHKVYIVNGPWITSYLKTLVKPFLSNSTTSKLNLLSSKENEWKKILQTNIPLNILPHEYGGDGPDVLS